VGFATRVERMHLMQGMASGEVGNKGHVEKGPSESNRCRFIVLALERVKVPNVLIPIFSSHHAS
jgi:hypothetical protein